MSLSGSVGSVSKSYSVGPWIKAHLVCDIFYRITCNSLIICDLSDLIETN